VKRAWYLGLRESDVGDRAVLVGDPDRVGRIAKHMEETEAFPVSRGLRTVTGLFRGCRITVAAYGMGSPIAVIVLHELAMLGTSRFVRIGTAMHFPPAEAGSLVVSEAALSFEGTSPAYLNSDGPIFADSDLCRDLEGAASSVGRSAKSGLFATFDAFYRDMFGIDESGVKRAAAKRAALADMGVLAADMETSALLAASHSLGVACASLCLCTVNATTQEKLPRASLKAGESDMFKAALLGLTAA